ncbi:hypothetical protein [Novosphingobium sp.]|uniref:hypothetical protein n=1 Tax=Novosphingobium sp. TaxID=1874826 RepID=UPI0022C6394F|nr:hypothetical protein [Novosphingobium sp.]MCZ8019713.1 hypothetical protein [Novosphingobium sp.]MCZ8035528.1 hypothetical protein [Novosphingobium sp.]MCZ8050842.1 hypothetical protein [Novosphingobium sp.]MCZ8059188.1 hypothetical protein [Novosphingobium sp.]MCZ8232634.1 hypothetical protein [Novosphingobium sp.]
MFIGHWAPALAAAAASPRAPKIGMLFIAAQLVDWAFFGLLLSGVEHMRFSPGISVMNPMDLYHMPITHSLLGSAAFAAAFAALLWLGSKDRVLALIGGAVVLSHWFLDLLVHVPDLTLAGSPPKLGLGLWNHPAIEMPLELAITFGALWWYAKVRRPARLRLGVLAALLLALQAFNWFGPVESEVTAGTSLLAFVAFGLVTLAAWWMGKSEAANR